MKREVYRNEKGQLHRIDGPAIINGDRQEWWVEGKLHRVDGPAYIDGNWQAWFMNAKLHHLYGPAYINGNYKAWYINGRIINQHEYIHEEIKEYNHYVI